MVSGERFGVFGVLISSPILEGSGFFGYFEYLRVDGKKTPSRWSPLKWTTDRNRSLILGVMPDKSTSDNSFYGGFLEQQAINPKSLIFG